MCGTRSWKPGVEAVITVQGGWSLTPFPRSGCTRWLQLATVRWMSTVTETSVCLIPADGEGDIASADAGAHPDDPIATANRGPPRATKREGFLHFSPLSPLLVLVIIPCRWQLLLLYSVQNRVDGNEEREFEGRNDRTCRSLVCL